MAQDLSILSNTPADEPAPKPGGWWHAEGDRVVCDLCPRRCSLKDGDRGFCFVRQNVDNRLVLTTYGRSTGFCVDPIEKKPLNHFLPGTSVLSFGTAGCNLGCKFCQNWDISKSREIERLSERALPEDIARAAHALGCRSVAFTYNDPVIWAEYAIETAQACREAGIRTVAVTAGYITEEAREPFFEVMDAANVDLKAFTEEFYHRLTLSHLDPVLETLRWLKEETDVWFEITNLIIPDANDDCDELQRLCDWTLETVGDEIPVHFTAFHPDFRMQDRPRTPPETLNLAREVALAAGLKYVYTGNVDDVTRQSTYCPNCGGLLIERNWYALGRYALQGNRCGHCGYTINGRFEERPGTWGRRRLPVDMRQFTPQSAPAATGGNTPAFNRVVGNPTFGEDEARAEPAPQERRPPLEDPLTKEGKTPMSTAAPARLELNDDHKSVLLSAAREIVQAATLNRKPSPPDPNLAGLADETVAGAFVSLKRKGRLRSCCGSFGQTMALKDALHTAATRAATDDPRFPRLSPNEVPHLELEVYVLHSPETVDGPGEARARAVTVGTHGLQVIRGNQRGLLLPSVPVENGWDAGEFLNQVCLKAGLPATAWKDEETTLLTFEGESFGDRLLGDGEADQWQVPGNRFSGREFAAYAQHCRSVFEALLRGSTPLYYCPSVSDANVRGVVVTVSQPETGAEMSTWQLSWKQTVPLQSTLFTLCQQLAQNLGRQGARQNDLQVDLTIADDVAMHGTASDFDANGLDSQNRGVLVQDRTASGWTFDPDLGPDTLVQEAVKAAEMAEPEGALVFSFAVQSTRDRLNVTSRPRPVQGPDVRPPAAAGTFYPADPAEMNGMLDEFLAEEASQDRWTAAMVPHAGWRFSGRLAADVLKRIEMPTSIIVIGPKHTPHGVEWAVAPHQTWSLPGEDVASDPELAQSLAEAIPGLQLDAAAHHREHGIEVELPLIARLAPEARVLGIAIGGGNLERCEQFADGLAKVIRERDEKPLLVISSDMNHFATDAETRRLDEMALAELDRKAPDALFKTVRENHISMCGMLPAVIVLKTLKKLDALSQAERVGYATTCDTTGDPSRVVGYAGMLFK